MRNMGTCRSDVKGAYQVGSTYKILDTDAFHRGGRDRSSEEGLMGMERKI